MDKVDTLEEPQLFTNTTKYFIAQSSGFIGQTKCYNRPSCSPLSLSTLFCSQLSISLVASL